jgi:hypothetical protein
MRIRIRNSDSQGPQTNYLEVYNRQNEHLYAYRLILIVLLLYIDLKKKNEPYFL